MFSDDVGSFKWQCIFENDNNKVSWLQIIIIGVKSMILLLVFGIISIIWFVLGLVTCGLGKGTSTKKNTEDSCETTRPSSVSI